MRRRSRCYVKRGANRGSSLEDEAGLHPPPKVLADRVVARLDTAKLSRRRLRFSIIALR